MRAKPDFRDREKTQVAVLDALANRQDEGMTVFELRSRVDADIDALEDALADLKEDGLIEVTEEGDRTVILPDEDVVGPTADGESDSLLVRIVRRLRP